MANSTDHLKPKTYEQLLCSEEITETAHSPLIIIAVINIFLSVAAILGNLLILLALGKESPLHPPSKLLLRSLATTDLCVGFFAQPTSVAYWISVAKYSWEFCRFVRSAIYLAGNMLCSVSLLTMTTIAVERLLALKLGLRYGQVVTLKRVFLLLTFYWVVSIVASTLHFLDYLISLWFGYMVSGLCLAISLFSYGKIFHALCLNQRNRVQHQTRKVDRPMSQSHQLNMARYRKAVSSALWLQVALVVCYVPYGAVGVILAASGLTPSIYLARQSTISLVFLNSSLNPVLYCWKIKEVRNSVKDTVKKLFPLSRRPLTQRK
ncbi:histamine H2 receptor-like [Montipora capricornis]|uniref:histamine H2 receptor-like n=1 Tax=Montipora capricornis TaxID=246305 RepID=UPI0035F1BBF5